MQSGLLENAIQRAERQIITRPVGENFFSQHRAQFVSGFSSPLVGWLVDRLGPRRLILIGGATLAVGLVASSQATELWHMVVLYGIVSLLSPRGKDKPHGSGLGGQRYVIELTISWWTSR